MTTPERSRDPDPEINQLNEAAQDSGTETHHPYNYIPDGLAGGEHVGPPIPALLPPVPKYLAPKTGKQIGKSGKASSNS